MGFLEDLLILDRIAANADDLDVQVRELLEGIAIPAGLLRSAAGHSGGEEVHHDDLLADVVR